jgi:hypothetical protein
MMNRNQRKNGMNNRDLDRSALDSELDAALAKFAAVEPRAGLEERVLANLHAERARAAEHSLWRWPAFAALAAVIIVALSVAWRSGKPAQKITMQPQAVPMQATKQVVTQVANNGEPGSIRTHDTGPQRRLKPRVISYPATVVAPAPKLDQFPSPQPLSEQEKILARYVANYPGQAALIAQARTQARTEDLRQDRDATSAGNQDSQQPNK